MLIWVVYWIYTLLNSFVSDNTVIIYIELYLWSVIIRVFLFKRHDSWETYLFWLLTHLQILILVDSGWLIEVGVYDWQSFYFIFKWVMLWQRLHFFRLFTLLVLMFYNIFKWYTNYLFHFIYCNWNIIVNYWRTTFLYFFDKLFVTFMYSLLLTHKLNLGDICVLLPHL